MEAKSGGWLQVIAIFKLLKGTLLTLVALGAFQLLHKDVADTLEHWVQALRLDPGNRCLAALLAKASSIDPRKLKDLGVLTLIYAALFLTEGVGLLFRKRWAEYLTTIATASLIPFEIYELCKHATPAKAALLFLNAAIVVYLIYTLRKNAEKT